MEKMMKKAQGMSLNVIVVAVIVLVVLVVLVLIFSGKIKMFGSKTSETSDQFIGNNCKIPGTNNECMDEYACNSKKGAYRAPPTDGFTDCSSYEGCCSS